jgi:hypothetical protein
MIDWIMIPYGLVGMYQDFGITYCLQHQGIYHKVGNKLSTRPHGVIAKKIAGIIQYTGQL